MNPDTEPADIRALIAGGIQATREITAGPQLSGCRVLSMFEPDEYVCGALRAGASGFLLKDAHQDQLRDAIRRTHAGESLFAPAILTRLVEHYLSRPAAPQLMHSGGSPPARPAHAAGAGPLKRRACGGAVPLIKTVKTHIGNLLSKLHAPDRAGIVIAAYGQGPVTAAGDARPGM